jgi:transcription initiation factor TFIID TATA-box-binding protein
VRHQATRAAQLQKKMEIVNIVQAVSFDCTFDLTDIVRKFDGKVDLPNNFNVVNIRLREKSFCQIFPNGKCIINGAKAFQEASELVSAYQCALQNMGYSVNILTCQVVNIIATYDHGKRVPLFKIAQKHKLLFEPEIFPAARVRMDDLKLTVNIFHTGKCVLLGAKAESVLTECVIRLQKLLESVAF